MRLHSCLLLQWFSMMFHTQYTMQFLHNFRQGTHWALQQRSLQSFALKFLNLLLISILDPETNQKYAHCKFQASRLTRLIWFLIDPTLLFFKRSQHMPLEWFQYFSRNPQYCSFYQILFDHMQIDMYDIPSMRYLKCLVQDQWKLILMTHMDSLENPWQTYPFLHLLWIDHETNTNNQSKTSFILHWLDQ